jgi:hypothetical protein
MRHLKIFTMNVGICPYLLYPLHLLTLSSNTRMKSRFEEGKIQCLLTSTGSRKEQRHQCKWSQTGKS